MTIQQAFDLALQHHQSGRLVEAETLYRQILAVDPRHADALNLLGVIASQSGRHDIAAALIRQAIALFPGSAVFQYNLGYALKELGRLDEAIAAYRHAVELKPEYAEAQNNLGNALMEQGRCEEALAAYHSALHAKPDYAEAHNNLGNALKEQGRVEEAIASYRLALRFKPDYAEAHNNLGIALHEKRQSDEAIAAYRQAIALHPKLPDAHSNLGNALSARGQFDEAIVAYHQAIALQPSFADAHYNLGNALKDRGQLDEAIAAYRQAIALQPSFADAHYNLGNALKDRGQLDEAIAAYRQAIALKPNLPQAHNNLGNALKEQGQLDEAIAAYRQTIALKPNDPEAHSNLILTLHYHPGYDAENIAEEYERWNRQHADPLGQFIQPHPNDPDPDRRLRIGYVSPDFRASPVGRFLLPLLAHHDHRQCEIFCYAQMPVPDDLTGQLRAHADHWHSLVGLSDAQAAELIRQHRIDILVDLALHTAHNRLLIFAHKPAPVQVSYLAYAASTGLRTMDYRLSDPFLNPPELDESGYAEQIFRLAQSYWCYQPVETPPIGPVPAVEAGHITFGCLNNFCKVSAPTLQTWARLLQAVPSAHLLLHAAEGTHRQRTADLLERLGADPRRVRFVGRMRLSEYLRLYGQIDIALDPFPFGGGPTTCDALWMGVPVVSLKGKTAVGRGGWSILSHIGLRELVADSEEAYVEMAAALAHDLPRLGHLRMILRQQMQGSPLMDAPGFARNVEAAYRTMWQRWCREKKPTLR